MTSSLSPDARNVYTASELNDGAVAVFDRDPVPGPGFSASTSRIDFGEVNTGTDSPFQTVTVTNTGTADLTISDSTLATGSPAEFERQADTCDGALLNPTESCSVDVSLSPTAQVASTTKLRFTHDGPGGPDRRRPARRGNGPGAGVLGRSGGDRLRQPERRQLHRALQTVTVTNTGSVNLGITSAGLSAVAMPATSLNRTTPAPGRPSHPPRRARSRSGFAPTATGARATELVFAHNAAGSPDEVDLTGTGRRPLSLSRLREATRTHPRPRSPRARSRPRRQRRRRPR